MNKNLIKILIKEGLALLSSFVTALLLFIFLEKKFSNPSGSNLKIAFFVFILMYVSSFVFRMLKGIMLIIFIAVIAGAIWLFSHFQ